MDNANAISCLNQSAEEKNNKLIELNYFLSFNYVERPHVFYSSD